MIKYSGFACQWGWVVWEASRQIKACVKVCDIHEKLKENQHDPSKENRAECGKRRDKG